MVLGLAREFGRGGLRLAWVRTTKATRIFARPSNWTTWFRVVRVLTTRETRPVVRAEPQVVLKHWRPYLGNHLTQTERAAILIDHYSFLPTRVGSGFFKQIVEGRLLLWEHVVEAKTCRIWLRFSRACHDEGDLELFFELEDDCVYTLACSIGPAHVAGLTSKRAIFIGRVQGKRDGLLVIREATRLCQDIAPAVLLLAAVEGLALQLGIDHLVGIAGSEHVQAAKFARPDGLVRSYDDFWIVSGGRQLERNMYDLPVPFAEKPILEVKRHHRSRTLRKRAFRKHVSQQVREALQERLLQGTPVS